MKPSRYNHFFKPSNGVTLAFNASSGALAEIEKEHLPRIEHLLKHPDQAETTRDKEFVDSLVSGGYLVGDATDEMAGLQVEANTCRLSKTTLALTIAPTMACNFNCDYCFESQSPVYMSRDTQKALIDFADRYLEQSSKLLISWFGGEPTICLPVVESLQNRLIEIAQKHQVEMEPASIISNGYLLHAKAAQRLRDMGIAETQITLDGPPEIHDRRRKLHDGRGTFARILDNISEISEILDVGVRINVDQDNIEEACRLVEILRDRMILPKVKVGFAQVQSTGEGCADMRDRCFGCEEFARRQVQLYKKLMSKGIYYIDYPEISGGVTCGAVSKSSFVVSPTGYLFKCWEELSADQEKSIGDIFSSEPTPQQKANTEKFQTWDPFRLTECRDCDILPICLGGCPIHGINSGNPNRGVCASWKYNLREMLELRHQCETAREAAVS